MTNIARDPLASRNHFADRTREERLTPGRVSQPAQHPPILIGIIRREDSDCVDYGIGIGGFLQYLPLAGMALVVAAVADDNEYLLVPVTGLQTIERHVHGIVKRGLACRRRLLDCKF